MFPSLRGDMDWWKYRSRSPLFFPKNMQESWEEWMRKGKLLKVKNGGEISPKRGWLEEDEGVFIPPPKM
jgi:hypothetical protein